MIALDVGKSAKLLAAEVRRRRRRLELSQRQAAVLTGIAHPNWVRLEAGRHVPHLHTLVAVAVGLGCTLGELVAPLESEVARIRTAVASEHLTVPAPASPVGTGRGEGSL